MDAKSDLEFLQHFRALVDEYLEFDLAPSIHSGPLTDASKIRANMSSTNKTSARQQINEMKARVHQLLHDLGVSFIMVDYPAPAVGGPVLRHKLFDLVTENRARKSMRKSTFLDTLDEAIGVLKSGNKHDQKKEPLQMTEVLKGFLFIAMPMGEDDPYLDDTHDGITAVAKELGLRGERVDDPATNEPISKRIIESLEKAEFVVADLTHSKPNVYFEAGYAVALSKLPIFIARQGTKVEFDLKDYPVIFFKNSRELKAKLRERLKGLMGLPEASS